jgi:hypothetical protein
MKNFFKFTKSKVFLAIFLFLASVFVYYSAIYPMGCVEDRPLCSFFSSSYDLLKPIEPLLWLFVLAPVPVVLTVFATIARDGDILVLAIALMLWDYFLSCVIIGLVNQARRLIKDSPSSD